MSCVGGTLGFSLCLEPEKGSWYLAVNLYTSSIHVLYVEESSLCVFNKVQ